MWDETLIESMGRRNNGKRWLTVQIAAIVHAGVIAILAAASFWYADAMSLPAPNFIPFFVSDGLSGSPPPPLGIPERRLETLKMNNTAAAAIHDEPVAQNQIVPEDSNRISDMAATTEPSGADVNLPAGVPWGVDGGDPNSNAQDNFGGGGAGISEDPPVDQIDFIKLGVERPVIIRQMKPEYPRPLLLSRIEGTVVLRALIDRNGDVQNITILRAAHPLLNQSAIQAVSQWKYRPAQLRGKPLAVYFQVTVVFKIR